MGIPNFHKWIKDKYPDCYANIEAQTYDNVLIDINCVMHRILYGNILNENVLFKRLYLILSSILKTNTPRKRLVLAIDGPPPLAKMLLQRERRLKLCRDGANSQEFAQSVINPLCFTPGTMFMKSLIERLTAHAESHIKPEYNIEVVVKSGVGESEFKIIKDILTNRGKSYLVVSTDADIIVMISSIMSNKIRNITVNNFSNLISMDSLITQHTFRNKMVSNLDFMLLSIMMGNDYLPKLSYVTLDGLWKAYRMTISKLVKNEFDEASSRLQSSCFQRTGSINFEFMLCFMRNIIASLAKQWIGTFHIADYEPDMYKSYLDGLQWCSTVYSGGICDQTLYMYTWRHSPHPFGLLFYIETNINMLKCDPINELEYISINDDIYALLVLPKMAYNLVSDEYISRMEKKFEFLYEVEECESCISIGKEIKEMYKKLKDVAISKQTPLRKKIGVLSRKSKEHSDTHKNISLEQIRDIINYLSQ